MATDTTYRNHFMKLFHGRGFCVADYTDDKAAFAKKKDHQVQALLQQHGRARRTVRNAARVAAIYDVLASRGLVSAAGQ